MKLLVCSRVSHFADDVPARCARCDVSIVHRPHAPADAEKLCERCAAVAIASSEEEAVIEITEETRRELALYATKTRGVQ